MSIDINKEIDEIYGPTTSSNLNFSNRDIFASADEKVQKSLKLLECINSDSKKEQFIKNLLSLPIKAFIKCEYVKCDKLNCEQNHGLCYYG